MPSVPPSIVLASASPRRRALLESAGLVVHVAAAACDETARPGEDALTLVRRLAALKLRAGRAAHPEWASAGPWLAADTVVASEDGELFGKPRDREDAERMLRRLSAGPHVVTTGWALDDVVDTESTRVWMRPLGERELARYLATDAWRDKAGGYGIQAEAAGFVDRIEGSYTNVVGLPLSQVLRVLHARTA